MRTDRQLVQVELSVLASGAFTVGQYATATHHDGT